MHWRVVACSSPGDLDDVESIVEGTYVQQAFAVSLTLFQTICCRRQQMANNLRMRHKVIKTIRNFLDTKDFLEVETPILGRATPEGARDFLVPSRCASRLSCLNVCTSLVH